MDLTPEPQDETSERARTEASDLARTEAVERAIGELPREEKSWRLMQAPAASGTQPDPREAFRPRSDADFTEVGLVRRAMPIADAFGGRLPLQKELKDIYDHFGPEIAQTVFTLCLERSPAHCTFLKRVRSFDPRTFELIKDEAKNFEVTIVRSSMPIDGIEWGEFATTWQRWARAMGFTTDIIETYEDDDLRRNAKTISTYLFSNPHPRRILVTYGQGAAEFRTLLTQRMGTRGFEAGEPAELSQIHTWINVAGAYSGAAIARFANDSWFQTLKLEFSKYFGRLPVQARATRVRQLDSRLPLWRTPPNFPAQMHVINVVGLAYHSELPMKLRAPAYDVAKAVGVNDGAIGLYESLAHPGLIVPVRAMSQFAESYKLEPVLRRLLALVVESAM